MNFKKYKKTISLITLSASVAILGNVKTEASNEYKLNNSVNIYLNAQNAKNKSKSVGKYQSGTYYIYKKSNGMINISKNKNGAGAWINPSDNTTNTSSKVTSSSGKYTLNNPVKVFGTASDAGSNIRAISTYSSGQYYIYKTYNGMLNISKTKGKPGGWINPNHNKGSQPVATKPSTSTKPSKNTSNKKPSTNTPKLNVSTNEGDVYVLNNSLNAYRTANDAKNSRSVATKYSAGKYYIFKNYQGVLNISKIKGQPGGWINPSENRVNSVDTKPTVENKSEKNDVFEEDTKEIIEKIEDIIEDSKEKVDSSLFKLTKSTKGYNTAVDAMNGRNSTTTYGAGSYHIYRSYKGMLNISTKKGRPGAWINPGKEISAPEANTNEAPKKSYNGLYIESKLPQIAYYNVYNELDAYKSSSEALQNLGSNNKVYPGKYYIYNDHDNMLNLTTNLSTPGSWINPNYNNVGNRVKPKTDIYGFINKIGPVAERLAKDSDVYASVMIAQTILETGYGTSELSSDNYNNFFGIKGSHNGKSAAIHTFEYRKDGSRYTVIAPFKSYDAAEQSLADYVSLITGDDNPNTWRYKFYYGARRSQTSSYKDAARYLTGRYATSPTYGDVLIGLIEKYNLTKYDPVEYKPEKVLEQEKPTSEETQNEFDEDEKSDALKTIEKILNQ